MDLSLSWWLAREAATLTSFVSPPKMGASTVWMDEESHDVSEFVGGRVDVKVRSEVEEGGAAVAAAASARQVSA